MKAVSWIIAILVIGCFFVACETIDDTLNNNHPIARDTLGNIDNGLVRSNTTTTSSVDSFKTSTIEIHLDQQNAQLAQAVKILHNLPDSAVWNKMKQQITLQGDSVIKIYMKQDGNGAGNNSLPTGINPDSILSIIQKKHIQ